MRTPAAVEHLATAHDLAFNWQYTGLRHELCELYSKAKTQQWNAEVDVDWAVGVDPEAENVPDSMNPLYGTEIWALLTPRELHDLRRENLAWLCSQFLHGEQGALITAAQIVTSVPGMDAKLFGSTQVVDEGRHVEVFDRYLRDKVGCAYPIDPPLKALIRQILVDGRWDVKYLGMQVLIEGLWLGAFATLRHFNREPLLGQILERVMSDEARHVAYGMLALEPYYAELGDAEREDRADVAYSACVTMRDRFLGEPVFIAMGLPSERCLALARESAMMQEFRKLLFSRVMPNLARLGLLTARLQPHYEALGLLGYATAPAT